jgi:hypothetical protein
LILTFGLLVGCSSQQVSNEMLSDSEEIVILIENRMQNMEWISRADGQRIDRYTNKYTDDISSASDEEKDLYLGVISLYLSYVSYLDDSKSYDERKAVLKDYMDDLDKLKKEFKIKTQ